MATCKNCLHSCVCFDSVGTTKYYGKDIAANNVEELCNNYKDRSRFVELPCNVGETVYCIPIIGDVILQDVVIDYDIWSIKNGIKVRISLLNHNSYVVGEFGKTVFLTREAAEKALAERMNK